MPAPKPKPKKIGRPALPKESAKSSIVPVRFSAEARRRVQLAAEAKGQTLSDFIRAAIEAAL